MDAQQEAPQETVCQFALPQPLEQYLFSNRAPLIWNFLPNELQETGSVISFKTLYLKLLSDPHSANALDFAINCPHS